jgi:endonuclease G
MKTLLPLLLTALLIASPVEAIPLENIHLELCPFGLPLGTSDTNDLVVRDIYALSSNPDTKLADWVVYRLDPTSVIGEPVKERNWKPDPLIDPTRTLEPPDYSGANEAHGYQRGHQAPLAAFKGTRSWSKTNYLSNITPQQGALNMGAWEALESLERNLASTGEVFVMTGTVYRSEMPALPRADEPHRVPSGYWKIMVVGYPAHTRAVGFFFSQDTPRRRLSRDDAVSIRDLEELTGLNFLWLLPDDQEGRIEGRVDEALVQEVMGVKWPPGRETP